MTQEYRLADRMAELSIGLADMLDAYDKNPENMGPEALATVHHTLGRMFSTMRELHAMFDTTLLEQGGN